MQLYVVFGLVLLFISKVEFLTLINEHTAHWLMGLGFGVFNLAYGVYLKLTLETAMPYIATKVRLSKN